MENSIQPEINLGIVGHVDHGKTTLTKLLSGKWTDTHSQEIKRGITIKLGYTNFTIYTDGNKYSTKQDNLKEKRIISIVDAPGHESFMATMISGAAIMDYALLVVAANEKAPQPQTIEHLKTLEISGINKIIIIQNKIDLVTKEEAIENFHQIKNFLKGTTYENSTIIPMSAQHSSNIEELIKHIYIEFPQNPINENSKPILQVIRSFDINKPGENFKLLKGGILGGSVKQGIFNVGDDIEIKPGISKTMNGQTIYIPIHAKIESMMSGTQKIEKAHSGGSIAIMTKLDPVLTKSDSLVGQVAGIKGELPEPLTEFRFSHHLFEKIIGTNQEFDVKPIIPNEALMLIVNSLTTVGVVTKVNSKEVVVRVKKPVMAFDGDRVVIFKRYDSNKWRISGYGIINI